MLNNKQRFLIKLKEIAWFDMAIILLPVLIPLAIYVWIVTLRLPVAKGDKKGIISPLNSINKCKKLTFIGESPVVGVGVECIEKGLVARTALHLSKQLDCPVQWQAIGVNGINISKTIDHLVQQLAISNPDYLVISLGVNDTKELTRFSVWEKEITRLIDAINKQCSAEIFFLGIPDMSKFVALPNPLGFLLGYRSKMLNNISYLHAYNGKAYQFILTNTNFDASYLAEDGFHPSAKGCDEIGKAVARLINKA